MNQTVANGLGLLNYIQKRKEIDRRNEYEDEVARHMQGFQQAGEAYNPGDSYNGKAFFDAQVGFVGSMLNDEKVKKMVFERQKMEMDASHAAVLDNAKKADGLRALGMEDQAINQMLQAYEAFPDGGDASWQQKDNGTIDLVIEFQDGSREVSNYPNKEKLWEGLQGHVQRVSDPSEFGKAYMGVRQQHIMNNAEKISNPNVLTNKQGELLYQVSGLIDTATGKPMNKQLENGIQVSNGQYLFDPKTGQIISQEEAQKRGFVSTDTQKDLADIDQKKANSFRNRALGMKAQRGDADTGSGLGDLLSPKSTEGKIAFDLVRYGVFDNTAEAMSYVVKAKRADNLDAILGKLTTAGYEPEDPEYQDVIAQYTALQPNLPPVQKAEQEADEEKAERGLPGKAKKDKEAAQETRNKIPSNAVKSSDGYTYWKENGKTYRVKTPE